jgi:hypothetical protein
MVARDSSQNCVGCERIPIMQMSQPNLPEEVNEWQTAFCDCLLVCEIKLTLFLVDISRRRCFACRCSGSPASVLAWWLQIIILKVCFSLREANDWFYSYYDSFDSHLEGDLKKENSNGESLAKSCPAFGEADSWEQGMHWRCVNNNELNERRWRASQECFVRTHDGVTENEEPEHVLIPDLPLTCSVSTARGLVRVWHRGCCLLVASLGCFAYATLLMNWRADRRLIFLFLFFFLMFVCVTSCWLIFCFSFSILALVVTLSYRQEIRKKYGLREGCLCFRGAGGGGLGMSFNDCSVKETSSSFIHFCWHILLPILFLDCLIG